MDSRASTLLRYRFADLSQLQNHLHVVDLSVLFFYREPKLELAGGARVVLEFGFTNTEQVSTLRGTVLARIDGGMAGLWLEFPDARLVKRTAVAAGVRGDLSEGEREGKFAGHSLRAGLASSAEVDER